MANVNDAERFERLIRDDGRYPLEAYEFLYRGLDRATRQRHGQSSGGTPRHVSGQELCHALREQALTNWGALARTVLARWNIHRTRDFGEMVFLLVNNEFMGKQDNDRVEDFDDVFDFGEAFGQYDIPTSSMDG